MQKGMDSDKTALMISLLRCRYNHFIKEGIHGKRGEDAALRDGFGTG